MNKKTMVILVAALIIIVVTTGCVKATTTVENRQAQASEDTTHYTHTVWYESNIQKITIPEDNVTCYQLSVGYGGGISCLRDEVKP